MDHIRAAFRFCSTTLGPLIWLLGVGGLPAVAQQHPLPPFDLGWGAPMDQVAITGESEQIGAAVGASLNVKTRNPEIFNVMGFFCADAGLQEVRVITYRYTRDRILPQFNIWLRALEKDHGAHAGGDLSVATAYWNNGLALEAFPATKTKYYLRVTYRGPDLTDACRIDN